MYYIKSFLITSVFILFFGLMFPGIFDLFLHFGLIGLLFYPVLFIVILIFLIKKKEKIDHTVTNFLQDKNKTARWIKYLGIVNTIMFLILFTIGKETGIRELVFWGLVFSGLTLLIPILFPLVSIWLAKKALEQSGRFSLFLYKILSFILTLNILIFIITILILRYEIVLRFLDNSLLY